MIESLGLERGGQGLLLGLKSEMTAKMPKERGGEGGSPRAIEAAGEEADAFGRVSVVTMPEEVIETPERAICAKDLFTLTALPALAAVAWTLPDALCLTLARALMRQLYRLRPERYGDFVEIFRDYLPDDPRPDKCNRLAMETAALYHLERLQLLRFHRPGSWRPKISLVGKEHLDRALARGKGAILWVTFNTFSSSISKVALHEQGYRVWHLSRHNHGHFSSTRFGMRFLNSIRIAVERRHLAGRIVIDPADPKAAVRRLEQLLAENKIVSITVGSQARRVAMAPFGPGYLPLAGGAPSLALKHGAALLPVFTERRPDGSFCVVIEPPLEAHADLPKEQKIADLIVRECTLLRRAFERLPTQNHYHDLHKDRQQYEAHFPEFSRRGGPAQ